MTTSRTTPRLAARVLLLDAQDRVLLLKWVHAAAPERGCWWITPGGGLEAGESYQSGAARELFEETGLQVDPSELGAAVLVRDITPEVGGETLHQHEEFFLLRVDAHEVDTRGFTAFEVANVPDHRWWTLPELDATDERVSPPDLPALLRRVAC